MKRGKPLKRTEFKRSGKGLAQGKGLPRGGRVNPRSDRNKAEGAERKVIRTASLGARCTIGPVLEELGIAGGCGKNVGTRRIYGPVEGLHERRKASSGGSKVNEANLMPACNRCNGIVEDCVGAERELIEASVLVVREGNPEWDSLSKRHDRTR